MEEMGEADTLNIEANRAFACLTLSAISVFPADNVAIRTRTEEGQKGSADGRCLKWKHFPL